MAFGKKKKNSKKGNDDPLAANLAALGLDPTMAVDEVDDDDADAQAELDAIMAGSDTSMRKAKKGKQGKGGEFDLAALKGSLGSLSTADLDVSSMSVSAAGASSGGVPLEGAI